MRRALTSDVTQPWNVNDSTQTQQTTSLGWVYCVAIWCMSGFSSTQTARAMRVVLFSVLTLRMCSHTIKKPEFCPCQRRQMNYYFVTSLRTICLWATRENEPRSDGFLVRFQHCRHHHTIENMLSDMQGNTFLRLERGRRDPFPATLGA